MYLTIICEYYSQPGGFYANVSLSDTLLYVNIEPLSAILPISFSGQP